MSIGPKPKHNPCVAMLMLVDGALKELQTPSDNQLREIYFLNIFRMLEVMKYNSNFPEYKNIREAFDEARPNSMYREDFIELAESACRLLGAPSPFTLDEDKLKIFEEFLVVFKQQLNYHKNICKEFD